MAGPDDDVAGSSQEAPSLAGLKQAMEEVAMQKDELLEFKKGILSVLSQLVSTICSLFPFVSLEAELLCGFASSLETFRLHRLSHQR